MKPPNAPDVLNEGELRTHLEQVNKVLSNVSFGSTLDNTNLERNINGCSATVTSPVAINTEFAVAHTLGRVPIGFFVLGMSKAGNVYKGVTAWTSTQIFLKETGGSNDLVLFIV